MKASVLCTAFAGNERLASGTLRTVAEAVKRHQDQHPEDRILVFDDSSSQLVEIDLRGDVNEVLARLEEPDTRPSPGRPKLGVQAKEVTLLPQHWEWLAGQPGGASVTLRKLVEEARRAAEPKDQKRKAQEACYRFMTAMAGDLPHYEDALRALFAFSRDEFETHIAEWPEGLRSHAWMLAAKALA